MKYLDEIDINKIPQHVAIIMDGNGRWAKQRGKERHEGHIAGAETVNEIIETAARLGIGYLTLYTFSTENWKRPTEEVKALMNLLLNSIDEDKLMENHIRFRTIGQSNRLPRELDERLQQVISQTTHNTGLTLVLALSYSARWEINKMVNLIAQEVKIGSLQPGMIDEECIQSHLNTHDMPDPDLLIRTGGEFRISNFLLWQCAYTELYFCDTYWPDFKKDNFYEAIYNYQHRERRFGMTSEQI